MVKSSQSDGSRMKAQDIGFKEEKKFVKQTEVIDTSETNSLKSKAYE